MAPTPAQPRALHHYQQAEQTLAALGSLGADEDEAGREALAALAHALLAIAAVALFGAAQ